MPVSVPPSATPSRTSTPAPNHNARFTSQTSTAEDLLKSQTVGLVHLSDFRKRRAEALEQKEREAEDRSLGRFASAGTSGTATPTGDGTSNPQAPPKKKIRKVVKGKLSFGLDDEDPNGEESTTSDGGISAVRESSQGLEDGKSTKASPPPLNAGSPDKKRLGPNSAVRIAPKVMTKSALLREAQTREQLRKEFLTMQRVVQATEVLIPFIFYDGTNIPGGICKVKKGDHTWVFLDRARKVGAELGVGGAGERASSKREWARVGVDDLMMIRGDIIIPPHYDFYYFIVNRTKGPSGAPLFDYSAQPTLHSPSPDSIDDSPAIRTSTFNMPRRKDGVPTPVDETLEGFKDEPTMTKVVDRRWYERNKHIFPASVWQRFDPEKDYSKAVKRDTGGNAFFFS